MGPVQWSRTLWAVGTFALAMGFLEAAVVVYLRLHFYPGGFSFPLVQMPDLVAAVEVTREVATLLMLACLGWIAGRTALGRWAYGAFAFGVWDLSYYVFLKLLLDWPGSLLTDDILFLIPIPWIGPVLAPVIVSIALICGGMLILRRESQGRPVVLGPLRWLFLCLAGLIIVGSFLLDTGAALHHRTPGPYPWYLFASGMILGLWSFVSGLSRGNRDRPR